MFNNPPEELQGLILNTLAYEEGKWNLPLKLEEGEQRQISIGSGLTQVLK